MWSNFTYHLSNLVWRLWQGKYAAKLNTIINRPLNKVYQVETHYITYSKYHVPTKHLHRALNEREREEKKSASVIDLKVFNMNRRTR